MRRVGGHGSLSVTTTLCVAIFSGWHWVSAASLKAQCDYIRTIGELGDAHRLVGLYG